MSAEKLLHNTIDRFNRRSGNSPDGLIGLMYRHNAGVLRELIDDTIMQLAGAPVSAFHLHCSSLPRDGPTSRPQAK